MQGAMIAPYDPHGSSAMVMAGRVDGRTRKKCKGMTVIPLDPSGFSALVEAGAPVSFWEISGVYEA